MVEQIDPFIGKQIDDYRVEALVGRGGMGSVYKAVDLTLRRPVAIKVLPSTAVSDETAVARFQREARLVSNINHPNIAQIYRIGEVDGCPYYAMEFIEGRSLQQILKDQGKISGSRSIKLMQQTAEGLHAASRNGVIHRDIKPANIMVTADDTVKIVDFGIAKAYGEDTFQTATGMLMGTPHYMSPEQAKGQKVDHRADIYSSGATFYHMVTGRPPFESDNPITLIEKHCNEPVLAIPQYNPNVPDGVCTTIYAMLAKNPSDRIQEYGLLKLALENAMHAASPGSGEHPRQKISVQAESPSLVAARADKSGKYWAIGIAVLVGCLMLVFVTSLLTHDGRTGPTKEENLTEREQAIRDGMGLIRIYREQTIQDRDDMDIEE
ncbi:MAG: serine/threonine protein kinase [Candidatus Sumerlaeota bacterium]